LETPLEKNETKGGGFETDDRHRRWGNACQSYFEMEASQNIKVIQIQCFYEIFGFEKNMKITEF
jgi:hypothetical protein